MSRQRPALRQALTDYLNLRRALGYQLATVGRLLGQFVSHLEQQGLNTITVEAAWDWATLPVAGSVHWRAIRLSAVRGFAAYLHDVDPAAQVVPPAE